MLSLFLQEAAVSSAPYFFGYMGAAFALGAVSATTCSRQFRTDEERIETESAHTNGSICSATSSLACHCTYLLGGFLRQKGPLKFAHHSVGSSVHS